MRRLQEDPVLVAATKVLDWQARCLPLPATLRIAADEVTFDHDWATLAKGILPEAQQHSFSRPMEIYRDLFDALFGFLGELNHYIDIGLVDVRQVSEVRYWLEQISKPRFGSGVDFHPFLKAYGYGGVTALMAKFDNAAGKTLPVGVKLLPSEAPNPERALGSVAVPLAPS